MMSGGTGGGGGGFEDDNPFGNQPKTDDNPFADPSVQKATAASGDKANLEDYNPFDGQKTKTADGGKPTAAINGQQAAPPPAYAPTGQQQISTAEFQRRQEELERRAKDLERREQELRNAPINGVRTNNFPPIPSFIPIQSCFYQDIGVEIPVEFQKIVTYIYYVWIAHIGLLFMNMMVGLLYLFVGGDMGQTFGLALIYFCIFSPASYVCWFRSAYKAFRDDSSFFFMVFFFVFFFQFLMSIINTLGIGSTGSCGLILGLGLVGGKTSTGGQIFVGVLILITAIGFGVCALADFFILTRVHKLYRSSGASIAKAQAEFASGVMKNEAVQRAATEAATASARNAFAGAANGGGNNAGGGSRF